MSAARERPQEIKRERVYGNFRQSALDGLPRPNKSAWRMSRPGNDHHYLAALRELGCILGCPPANVAIDSHHLKSGPAAARRGVGMRAPDQFAIPLCRFCHDEIERLPSTKETDFFKGAGIMIHLYAQQSWRSWQTFKDPGRLKALFTVHQQEAIRRLSRQVASGRRRSS
jgi:hypothetical protein